MENKNYKDYTHRVTIELSIRRKNIIGLPGEDPTLHNMKLGASLKGNAPLKGLDYEEEIEYLPEIIGISPNDPEWRKSTANYWNNISVKIPADGVSIGDLQGYPLKFTFAFKDKSTKEEFEKVTDFAQKAEISKKGMLLEGAQHYILFRYALVNRTVANNFKDIRKSAKILFYLYSKANKLILDHTAFKVRVKVNRLFTEMLMDIETIDGILLMFGADMSSFEGLPDKHLALEALIKKRPTEFIAFAEDGNLKIKGLIKKAVTNKILHSPINTDSYYYGENNEVTLGTTLEDAVIYWKSEQNINKEIIVAIKARLSQI